MAMIKLKEKSNYANISVIGMTTAIYLLHENF